MEQYKAAIAALNDAQRQAVNTTEGPLLVVAGPGTGKTQLLALRVGAILHANGGVLPSNILCLTFTDAAAANLRARLIEKVGLGQAAYQVAIHTFHSFGSWIMATYPEYFFAWQEATTADQLATNQILEQLLRELPADHELAKQGPDGTFFALRAVRNFISDAKRANLLPKDVHTILETNNVTYDLFGKIINTHWPERMSDKALDAIYACIDELNATVPPKEQLGVTPIAQLILQDLQAAASEANTLEGKARTKPFTAWKNAWLELNDQKKWIFKAAKHHTKLLAACDLYQAYQKRLVNDGLVDFDDQIVTVLAALKKHEALRYNLQERFLYIMIDEYQDTNRAQLQMAQYLTDAPVHEGRPNIMVVGDDDQAIYRFQGADMSNIGLFESLYRDPQIVRLQENYRSNRHILSAARKIGTQIRLSLEKLKGISKELNVQVADAGAGTLVHEFAHESEHHAWVAAKAKRALEAGRAAGKTVAILARERTQLDVLVPYLRDQNVPIDYERRESVLDQPHVVALLKIATLVQLLAEQKTDEASALLPEILSHPMWGIQPSELWHIHSAAQQQEKNWLDVIFEQTNPNARRAADFLYGLSQRVQDLSLDQTIDALIGIGDQGETFGRSPFKTHYFGQSLFDEHPGEYLTLLSHLSSLRRHLAQHLKEQNRALHLQDLLTFVDDYKRAGLIMIDSSAHREQIASVQLMTAHKAKGQEFDTVFIVGANDNVWQKTGGGNKRLSYPQNLQEIKPSDNDADDALRLFFVAMTRAQQNLHICYFRQGEDGKAQQPFAAILGLELPADTPTAPKDPVALITQYEQRWQDRHASAASASKHALLADRLANYKLSATHFTDFLDISRGGPQLFLTKDLLRFPEARSPHASYGMAVHATLQQAHQMIRIGATPTTDMLLAFFKAKLESRRLSERDFTQFLSRGTSHLQQFFDTHLIHFSPDQHPEVGFATSGVAVDGARLTGSLDLLSPNTADHTLLITDYKTGKAHGKWEASPSAADRERIKLHRYRQQLLFYAILTNQAPEWGGKGWQATAGRLVFVEPDDYGKLRTLEVVFDADDLARTQKLIARVWHKIINLDFATSDAYSPDFAGILQFEADLLNE